MTTSNITLSTDTVDTITISDIGTTIDLASMSASYGYTGGALSVGAAPSYSYNPYVLNTGSNSWSTTAIAAHPSGTIELQGENADIRVNGESLMDALKEIREQLRIPSTLVRNAELEKDFEDLRDLATEYEKKVEEYKEKKRAWDILRRD